VAAGLGRAGGRKYPPFELCGLTSGIRGVVKAFLSHKWLKIHTPRTVNSSCMCSGAKKVTTFECLGVRKIQRSQKTSLLSLFCCVCFVMHNSSDILRYGTHTLCFQEQLLHIIAYLIKSTTMTKPSAPVYHLPSLPHRQHLTITTHP
jgi:hypothetical protein